MLAYAQAVHFIALCFDDLVFQSCNGNFYCYMLDLCSEYSIMKPKNLIMKVIYLVGVLPFDGK